MTFLEPELEETLRSYVLGTLDEDPRLQLEERLLRDPDAFEALGVIEDELTEEYLEGTLTEAERLGFERHYLSSPEGRRVPGFLDALKARASVSTAVPPTTRTRDLASRFRPVVLRPAWVGAVAAVLALSLAGNAWLALRQGSLEGQVAQLQAERPQGQGVPPSPTNAEEDLDPQLAELAATNQELEARLEAEGRQRERAETLVRRLERAAHQARTSVPTFTLAAGVLRGEDSLARVVVPPDTEVVRLVLDLPSDEYPLYSASLHDVDGDELWAQSRLRAEETRERIVLSLLLPTSLLPYGDYQVKVGGIGGHEEPEALASYTFRVITE